MKWLEQKAGKTQKGLEIFGKALVDLCQDPEFRDKVTKLPATFAGLLALNYLPDERIRDEVKRQFCLMLTGE